MQNQVGAKVDFRNFEWKQSENQLSDQSFNVLHEVRRALLKFWICPSYIMNWASKALNSGHISICFTMLLQVFHSQIKSFLEGQPTKLMNLT